MLTAYQDDMRHEGASVVKTLGSATPTARKTFICDACRATIAAGSKYRLHVSVIDGEFDVMRWHDNYRICARDDGW